jgi:hypothetical protein
MKVAIKITVATTQELVVDVNFPCYVKYVSFDDGWRDYRLLRRILESGEYIELKRAERFSGTPEFSLEYGYVNLATELAYYFDPNKKYEYELSTEREFKEILAEMLLILDPVLGLTKS